MKRRAIGLLLASALSIAACTTTAMMPSGPDCRTYATAGTHAYASHFYTSAAFTSEYNPTTNRWTTRWIGTLTSGGTETSETVTSYRSVADFVDELATNPPLVLSTGLTSTGAFEYVTTNTYDGQRRQAGSAIAGGGRVDTTTYSAWDASGRPTAGTEAGPGYTNTLALTYDDAARTLTTTETSGNVVITVAQSYTNEGEPLHRTQASNQTNSVSTRTTTITSTAQACK